MNDRPHDHANWDWIIVNDARLNISSYSNGSDLGYGNLLQEMLQTNVIRTVD